MAATILGRWRLALYRVYGARQRLYRQQDSANKYQLPADHF
jgi:hypothetical protein